MTACPACGASVGEGDRFCESCGSEVAKPTAAGGAGAPAAGGAGAPADGGAGVPGGRAATESAPPCASCGAALITADGYCDRCGRRQRAGRDHVEIDLGIAAGVSDRGRRHPDNEDAIALARVDGSAVGAAVLAVVCDGVSSSVRAADASKAAAGTALAAMARELKAGASAVAATRTAITEAAAAVAAIAGPVTGSAAAAGGADPPSSTYVSAVVTATDMTIGWVGDSRAYWLAGGATGTAPTAQLTTDDSWAAAMVASGALTEAAAYADEHAHAISAWLGADAGQVRPHVAVTEPGGPGVAIVCSDGLWNYLPEAAALAGAAMPQAAQDPLLAARHLLRIALEAGGSDNITVAVIPFPPPQAPANTDDTATPVRGPHD